MKKMKKLLSMLLAVVMVLAMAAPSFADETDEASSGSITISNATLGEDYGVYRLFEANPSLNDEEKDIVAYTATALQYETISAYVLSVANEETGNTATYENPFIFEQTLYPGIYNVKLNDKYKEDNAYVIAFLQGLFKERNDLFEQQGEIWKANDVKHTFNNLPYGYYFMTSSLGTVVSITSTNPSANVIDKNQGGPEWTDNDKSILLETTNSDGKTVVERVKEISANFTDTVDYEVSFKTTNYKGELEILHYYLKDDLAAGLSYKPETLKVKVGNIELTKVDSLDDLKVTEDNLYPYYVKFNNDGVNGAKGKEDFEITILWYNESNTENPFIYTSPNTVTVTYSASVENDAVIAGDGNKNVAQYGYDTRKPEDPTPDPKDPSEKTWDEEKETVTYVYALAVLKTDSEKNPLAGAKFTLQNTEGINVQLENLGNGVYNYMGANNASPATEMVSPESGKIIIKGIKGFTEEEAENKKYILTEIEAPNGYNLLTEPVKLTPILKAKYTKKYKVEYTETTDEDGKKTLTSVVTHIEEESQDKADFEADEAVLLMPVINYGGTLLPSTGGIGTTIFYAAGIILMAGAVFFVVRRKRA